MPILPSKQPNSISRGNSGFTLIELLCVIAIIAIMASLMMPEFEQVRKKAESTQCASNLRQLGIVVNLYLSENDNKYPYIEPGKPGSGLVDPYANQPDLQAQAKTLIDTFQPYGLSEKNLQCPTDMHLGKSSAFAQYGTSYYWNPLDDGDLLGNVMSINRRMGLRSVLLSKVKQADDFNPIHKLNGQGIGKNALYADGKVVAK